MSDKKYLLPEYPIKHDMWDEILESELPVTVYGMGNGADKLFLRLGEDCAKKKIKEIFASDGFVRGHSFRGYKVKTLSDVKNEYSDFLILLSFASNRSDVIEMIKRINSENKMLIPDMPVTGESYFDKEFYNSNYENIKKAYDALADEESKKLFSSIINYKLSGRAEYLFAKTHTVSEIYSLLGDSIKTAIDAGAYNGDTAREMQGYFSKIEKIYAIEPDKRNFKKLSKYVNENGLGEKIVTVNAGVWSENSEGVFNSSANRNSSISSTVSFESKSDTVPLVSIDSLANEKIDYIKYDVEGAEREALRGSFNTIEGYRPRLLISAYHRSEDIFTLVNYMKENHPYYSLYMRRSECFPAWEIAIIAIPE
ncbi:MAG: FkbM family methyltransferase [Ruminococcaceae bacterium]|nr:FkbM family methyltransferase [Oscillospiraceae bacterium]